MPSRQYQTEPPPGFKWRSVPEKWASQLQWVLLYITLLIFYMWDVQYAGTEFEKSFGIALVISVLVLQGFSYFLKRGKFDSGRDWLYQTREQALANWWLKNPEQDGVTIKKIMLRPFTPANPKSVEDERTIITFLEGAPTRERDLAWYDGTNDVANELYPPKS